MPSMMPTHSAYSSYVQASSTRTPALRRLLTKPDFFLRGPRPQCVALGCKLLCMRAQLCPLHGWSLCGSSDPRPPPGLTRKVPGLHAGEVHAQRHAVVLHSRGLLVAAGPALGVEALGVLAHAQGPSSLPDHGALRCRLGRAGLGLCGEAPATQVLGDWSHLRVVSCRKMSPWRGPLLSVARPS